MLDPDPRLLDAVAALLPPGLDALCPSHVATAALVDRGITARCADVAGLPPEQASAILLLGDELSLAGEHAEGLLATAAVALRPGGLLLVAARNRVHALATGTDLAGLRAWSADELARTVGHPGIAVEHVLAPGAAAALRDPAVRAAALDDDVALDRSPGLADAAPQTLVVGRRPLDVPGRSAAFFASVPTKLLAAAVVCRDASGRLLVVRDSFRGHWTIPGGVVDAGEDPCSAAVRETYEEAGLRVVPGPLLGVFAMPWPDRVLFVYGATAPEGSEPAPLHAHEIDDAAWLPLDAALVRLNARTAAQVRRCLSDPGATWADKD